MCRGDFVECQTKIAMSFQVLATPVLLSLLLDVASEKMFATECVLPVAASGLLPPTSRDMRQENVKGSRHESLSLNISTILLQSIASSAHSLAARHAQVAPQPLETQMSRLRDYCIQLM